MPAIYAHDRFGEKVAKKLDGELKRFVFEYYPQFEIGLQGPDIFFFYRPYTKNRVVKYGNHLHAISAKPFFEHEMKVINKRGRDSAQYAYLLGFICHYILDSECHPYVEQMIEKTGVQHLEIEEEFEKYLLKKDGQDPLSFRLAALVPTDVMTAKAIAPFYENITWKTARKSLYWLRFVKNLFRAPRSLKRGTINTVMRLTGQYDKIKGLMHQKKDHPKCTETNKGLNQRLEGAVDLAVMMMESFDESLRSGLRLNERFDRTFE